MPMSSKHISRYLEYVQKSLLNHLFVSEKPCKGQELSLIVLKTRLYLKGEELQV